MIDINDNLLVHRWEERLAALPQEIQNKIQENRGKTTQLKTGKKSRKYPEIGDVFSLVSNDDIQLNGIVINNNIKNINGEKLLVVAIFRPGLDYQDVILKGLSCNNLIMPIQIVGPEYWTRGLFSTFDHFSDVIICDTYGFYSIGKKKFLDEYGVEMNSEPNILGTFGVSTINGISTKLDTELIINRLI